MSASHFVSSDENGINSINLLVDGMHCPSCVAIIEGALKKQSQVTKARLNLSTKRLAIAWNGEKNLGDKFIEMINGMGYRAVPFDLQSSETSEKREEKFLLRCLAVAGFASGNLMLFSIPLWTSDSLEMGIGTRTMFQWIQALISIPALAYSGQPFFRSAWKAIKDYRTNMDVPISVAIILATLMSLFETITHGKHAYFDSAVMLIFFLLIGRYLEARARGQARSAASDLLQMMTGTATIINADGRQETIPLSEIKKDMIILVAMGEKIGADGEIIDGESEIDTSLITGETIPQSVKIGGNVFAGTINISAPLKIKVTKAGNNSLIAEIVKLMETAEQSQARYVTLADRISAWYTPAVHILAAATFLGWVIWGDIEWQVALLYAATVLIITCPCALGLAVPVVQVLASGKLLRSGILLKSGSALERLAIITNIVFDKTGTLTLGKPELINPEKYKKDDLKLAASLAANSKHPLSQSIMRAYGGSLTPITAKEIKGHGIEAEMDGIIIRLGKGAWCSGNNSEKDTALELWLNDGKNQPLRFTFADKLRDDAKSVVKNLQDSGQKIFLLSGDRKEVVSHIAKEVGIENSESGMLPLDKVNKIKEMQNSGAKVLMVGDGLNDAPSLASADISISPANAIDITQNAADIVFQGDKLSSIITAWNTAKFSQVLVKENFGLALFYNIIAIPLAVMGYVTPLVAAIAMSSSSLIVIANAMRLNFKGNKA